MSLSIRVALLAAAVSLTPALATADTIHAGDTLRMLGSNGTISGGAFSVDLTSTGPGVDFLTFCLQRSQFMDYSSLFTVGAVSDAADDAAGPDPLSPETQWIYAAYRAGTLGGYSSDDIQAAIWTLEGEWSTDFGKSTMLIAAAQTAIAGGYSTTRVRVLNLFFADGRPAQDQLTLTQVPEPASLALFGMGLVAVARAARRRRT